MKDLTESKVSSEQIFSGLLLDVRRDEVSLPEGGTSVREYIRHPGAVVIIPILPDGKILLIRQFRYPMGDVEIELPAGKIDPGEEVEETLQVIEATLNGSKVVALEDTDLSKVGIPKIRLNPTVGIVEIANGCLGINRPFFVDKLAVANCKKV